MTANGRVPFDLAGPLPEARIVIEASAGTGKTYTIAALVTRYVVEAAVPIDQFLVVTFTRAAASELRDRIRAKLRMAADVVAGLPVAGSDAWMQPLAEGTAGAREQRAQRLHQALARFDEATITTIHGFCQQSLAQSGLRSAGDPGAMLVESTTELVAEVARDLLVRELAHDPYALSTDARDRPVELVGLRSTSKFANAQPNPPIKVERDFIATVHAVLTNAGARTLPLPSIGGIARRWADLVDEAVATVDARQRARRQIGYDRLVSDLRHVLVDPVAGPPLAAQLASRFPVVLVDEFQDTDRMQWDIFQTAFGGQRLITVGDPKQAIYRFRGADVHAYLAAVRSSRPASLAVNHRSDRRLLDGLGVLFNGVTLGHRDIEFVKVDASETAPRSAITEGRTRAAVHLRVVPDSPAIPHNGSKRQHLESGAVQRIVLTDLAARVRTLLDTATLTGPTGTVAVKPGDIAVLVPSQRRASDTAAVLREWGIPSVRARTGSVLDTDAAMHWRLLLAGLAAPTRPRVARGAGLSWFFDVDPATLADGSASNPESTGDSPLVELQQKLAVLAEGLRVRGIGAFYEHLRSESRLLDVVLAAPNGDRHLTDVDHIGDLLVAELHGQPTEPLHVQQVFDQMIADSKRRGDGASEATMRRIETDDQAVHITTVHAAKGLEYPIVLLPFGYSKRANASRPYVFNDESGERVVDVASWVAWADGFDEGSKPGLDAIKQRKALATAEVDGDGLRTLYVAMTRAKHRLEMWWAPTERAESSALGRLLFDRDGAGPVHNSEVGADYEKVHGPPAQIDALAAASGGSIAVFDVAVDQPVRRPLDIEAAEPPALAVADGSSRAPLADPSWRVWSFTAMSAAAGAVEPGADIRAPAVGPPIAGGLDEGTDLIDPEDFEDVLVETGIAGPLAGVVGGTAFGTMVHGVFEHLDFTSPTLLGDVRGLVAGGARANGLGDALDVDVVASGLAAAVATPLGPLFAGRALADLAVADRLAELTFDLRLQRRAGAELGVILSETLGEADPFRSYAADLADQLEPVELAGWLTGSIDAVFRIDGPTGSRYVVVDYKTNRLPSYRPDRLVDAMTHSNYPLQALLYSVALHRYLRWRLGVAYRPHEHLGGIAYLFLRGMAGPDTPRSAGAVADDESHGVFSWRPSVHAIEALDRLLVPA